MSGLLGGLRSESLPRDEGKRAVTGINFFDEAEALFDFDGALAFGFDTVFFAF
jgi:hypothetical protein